MRLEKQYSAKPWDDLPVPTFSFHDRFGIFGSIQTRPIFLLGHITLIMVVCATLIFRTVLGVLKTGGKTFLYHYIKPAVDSFLLVLLAVFGTLGVSMLLSKFKRWVNPGVVYGYPILSVIANLLFCMASFCFILWWWPIVSRILRLSSLQNQSSQYELIGNIESPDDDSGIDGQTAQLISDRNDELFTPRRMQRSNTGKRVISAWLPVGLTGFWMLLTILSLIASSFGLSFMYFIFEFGVFSVLALGLSMTLEFIYRRLLREDLDAAFSVTQIHFINFYQDYYWGFQVLISSIVPVMFLMDVFTMLLDSIPSLIMEGIQDEYVDFGFSLFIVLGLVNFMPVLAKTPRRQYTVVFFLWFLCLWIPQLFVFPFSPDRPYKFGIREKLNITNGVPDQTSQVTVACPPIGAAARLGNSSWLLECHGSNLNLLLPYTGRFEESIKTEVSITGVDRFIAVKAENTRVCEFWFPQNVGNVTVKMESINGEEGFKQDWIHYENGIEDSAIVVKRDQVVQMYARPTASRDTEFKFGIRSKDPLIHISIDCHYEISSHSDFFKQFMKSTPDWTAEAISGSRGGSFVASKVLTI